MSRKKDRSLKETPPVVAGDYDSPRRDGPKALPLAIFGTTGEDLERLRYWHENANSDDGAAREVAWWEFAKIQEGVERALCELDAEFFERMARLCRAVKSSRRHEFAHHPVAVGLLHFYPVAGLEARLKQEREGKSGRLPYFRELLEECSKWESWPKHGETEKIARKIAKLLGLKFAPEKPGPKGPRKVRR